MKWSTKYQWALIFNVLSISFLNAQNKNSDLESWNGIDISYEQSKKWTFGLEEQLRLDTNISEIKEYFTEVVAEYSLNKKFKLAGGFRYIRENDNEGAVQGYENHIRFHTDLSYKHKIHDISLKYRFRYQNKNELGVSNADGDYANQHFRLKTALKYSFKNWKLDPVFAAELFHQVEKGEADGFDKYRLTLGSEYKINKKNAFGFYYRFEKELNETTPFTTHIIGLKYTCSLKKK